MNDNSFAAQSFYNDSGTGFAEFHSGGAADGSGYDYSGGDLGGGECDSSGGDCGGGCD